MRFLGNALENKPKQSKENKQWLDMIHFLKFFTLGVILGKGISCRISYFN